MSSFAGLRAGVTRTHGVTSEVRTSYPSGALKIAPLFSGVLVYHFDQLPILIFLVTCCDVLYDFRS
jgi:hypothetical protein